MIKTIRILIWCLLFPVVVQGQNARQFFRNGQALAETGNPKEAARQFSKAVEMDSSFSEALFRRAECLEKSGEPEAARVDYKKLLARAGNDPFVRQHLDEIRNRLFELNRETDAPVITLLQPELPPDSLLSLPRNLYVIPIKVQITDKSDLERVTVNNQTVPVTKSGNTFEFTTEANLSSSERITLTVTDVYENTRKVRFAIQRTETDPPRVSLRVPYASDDGEIFLEAESRSLEVEGNIQDESLISDITVDGNPAIFNRNERNPDFIATLDVADKYSFTVTAADIYGNDTSYTYVLNREAMLIHDVNPTGRTWVVIIENTDYQGFPSLDASSPDVSMIRSSLSRYVIHRIIQKKDMTKMEMERFFSIELRDLLKDQDIGSLMIWFEGHGSQKGEGGYWIPVDARRDDVLTWYNLHALRASLLSYNRKIAHFLVVSDACPSGPAFCTSTLPDSVTADCSNPDIFRSRSAQSLSVPGADQGLERSLLARIVSGTLDGNTDSCLPVESIVAKLNEALKVYGITAEFGPVMGLPHEGGTFYFMTKSEIQ